MQSLEADRLVEIFGPILKLLLAKLERVAFVHDLLVSVLMAGKPTPSQTHSPAAGVGVGEGGGEETPKGREKVRAARGRSQSSLERQQKRISRVATSPTLGRNYLTKDTSSLPESDRERELDAEENGREEDEELQQQLQLQQATDDTSTTITPTKGKENDERGSGLKSWMDRVNLEITEEYRNQVRYLVCVFCWGGGRTTQSLFNALIDIHRC